MSEPSDKQVEQPNPIAKVFGTWPGDETDAELQKDVADLRVEQPKAGELPPFDWKRMEEIAADPLCEEHDFREYCAACLAIEGTRWALKMRDALRAEQQVSAGLREERNCPKCAGKGCYECKSSGSQVKRLLGINEELVNSHNSLLQDAANQQRRAEAAEAFLAEARAENELLKSYRSWDRIHELEAELATLKAQEAPEKAWERAYLAGALHVSGDLGASLGGIYIDPYTPPKESK